MKLQFLLLTLTAMLVTVTAIYSWYFKPILAKLKANEVLQILLVVHCFRFISPISLVSGVTLPGLSTNFIYPQVFGDIFTAACSLISIQALRKNWPASIPLVWFTNMVGIADLVIITVQGVRYDFSLYMGAMFYIVIWYVPWLLLSHTLIFNQLFRKTNPEH